jgi:hypothetical protein|eukprot:COSAG01_NODE_22586_length_849_cov_6.720000_1_plen_64_part_00
MEKITVMEPGVIEFTMIRLAAIFSTAATSLENSASNAGRLVDTMAMSMASVILTCLTTSVVPG